MTEPHDAPSIAELLAAVRSFLRDRVMPETEGTLRFHARVAANALEIAERELALSGAQREAHRARLAALGFESDADLAAAIRSGALDDRYHAVATAVRESVRDKLLVANPAYLENDEPLADGAVTMREP